MQSTLKLRVQLRNMNNRGVVIQIVKGSAEVSGQGPQSLSFSVRAALDASPLHATKTPIALTIAECAFMGNTPIACAHACMHERWHKGLRDAYNRPSIHTCNATRQGPILRGCGPS